MKIMTLEKIALRWFVNPDNILMLSVNKLKKATQIYERIKQDLFFLCTFRAVFFLEISFSSQLCLLDV